MTIEPVVPSCAAADGASTAVAASINATPIKRPSPYRAWFMVVPFFIVVP